MNKTICPGQDTRYWRPDDIFEVECIKCGTKYEFFKDEASHKCPKCGNRVQNPKINLGCAQWCEHAKECLGYDPKSVESSFENENDIPLTDKILNEIKLKFGNDSSQYNESKNALSKAEDLLKEKKSGS